VTILSGSLVLMGIPTVGRSRHRRGIIIGTGIPAARAALAARRVRALGADEPR